MVGSHPQRPRREEMLRQGPTPLCRSKDGLMPSLRARQQKLGETGGKAGEAPPPTRAPGASPRCSPRSPRCSPRCSPRTSPRCGSKRQHAPDASTEVESAPRVAQAALLAKREALAATFDAPADAHCTLRSAPGPPAAKLGPPARGRQPAVPQGARGSARRAVSLNPAMPPATLRECVQVAAWTEMTESDAPPVASVVRTSPHCYPMKQEAAKTLHKVHSAVCAVQAVVRLQESLQRDRVACAQPGAGDSARRAMSLSCARGSFKERVGAVERTRKFTRDMLEKL